MTTTRSQALVIGSVFAILAAFPQQFQSRLREGREIAVEAVREAQRMLAPELWAKLPDAIREPFRPCEGSPGFIFAGPR